METIIIYSYIFFIGITFGSFFNVVGLRVPERKSIIPRSACPNCNRTLRAWELIPIISYIFLLGKSKCCKTQISAIYPFFELLTGLLFTYAFYQFGWSFETLVAFGLISLLMIIFVSDIRYQIIPDKVLLFFAPLLLFMRYLLAPPENMWDPLLGSIIGFSLLYFLAVVSKGGMGGGDIKLYAVLGIVLGWKSVLLSFFLSAFICAFLGIFALAFKIVKPKQPIPFGPYIVVGTLITYFRSEVVLQWYFDLFKYLV